MGILSDPLKRAKEYLIIENLNTLKMFVENLFLQTFLIAVQNCCKNLSLQFTGISSIYKGADLIYCALEVHYKVYKMALRTDIERALIYNQVITCSTL